MTLPGPVIRLLTPTQDLVFARSESEVTRSGGGFRGLFSELQSTSAGQAALNACKSDLPFTPGGGSGGGSGGTGGSSGGRSTTT